METLNLDIDHDSGFEAAKKSAQEVARKKLGEEPMLWSWYDGRTCTFSPTDPCGDDPLEGIERYAENRGGNLKVLVGKNRYGFCFGPSLH